MAFSNSVSQGLVHNLKASTLPQAVNSPHKELLDSWKQIAVFLNRGVRTVQRWERDEGLPVHRHGHGKPATVLAYRSEIQRWIDTRREDHAFRLQQISINTYEPTSDTLIKACIGARLQAEQARKRVDVLYESQRSQIAQLIQLGKYIKATIEP